MNTDATAEAARAHQLQAAQSLAMLEAASAASDTQDDSTTEPVKSSSLSVQISVRRGRLALLVGLVTCVVIALTLVLWRGAELKRFTRDELSVSDQEKLLDQYNSYSGNVASALGRPLELFVALMAHVVVLWLMTDAVLSVETSWRVKLAVLALGASVGFLLTNGLNALNVQVRELPLTMVMSTSDMSVRTNYTSSSSGDQSFSESSAENPTANTILRSLLLPLVPATPSCSGRLIGIARDSVSFGMAAQPWMKYLIPEALPDASVRIDLLTNDTSEAKEHLPMDASVAADLLLAGYSARDDYSPVGNDTTYSIDDDLRDKDYSTSSTEDHYVPIVRLAGLLPNDSSSSESQKREWFLSRSVGFIRNATLPEWQNASLTRWTMTLSRVNITPSVWVEAITVESEVTGMDLFHFKINGSRYYPIPMYRTFGLDNRYPEAKINAFAVCNDSGVDGITTFYRKGGAYYDGCMNKSTTSMYVFSSGKHLVGEAVNGGLYYKNGSQVTTKQHWAYVKDLRYVYSTTFSRINWRLQNLSEIYGAACHDDGGCMGVEANLTSNQRLLVSVNALPLDQVVPISFMIGPYARPQEPLEVVSVYRPSTVQNLPRIETKSIDDNYDRNPLGDFLLHHNILNLTSDKFLASSALIGCDSAWERRVLNYIYNHIYMETTLQATYTAAALFLFQNGIARDVLNQTAQSSDVSLKLDENVQEMSVRLAIPGLNAGLTLAGCVVLVVALSVALIASHFAAGADSPTVQDPHQIARVMVDDTTFPSLLLKRHVVDKGVERDADEYLISTLCVRPMATIKVERSTEATAA